MIRILFVHNADIKGDNYLDAIKRAYPYLYSAKDFDGSQLYSVQINKLNVGGTEGIHQPYNNIYFDRDTVKPGEVLDYIIRSPKAVVTWISFTDLYFNHTKGAHKRASVFTKGPIKNLKEKLDDR